LPRKPRPRERRGLPDRRQHLALHRRRGARLDAWPSAHAARPRSAHRLPAGHSPLALACDHAPRAGPPRRLRPRAAAALRNAPPRARPDRRLDHRRASRAARLAPLLPGAAPAAARPSRAAAAAAGRVPGRVRGPAVPQLRLPRDHRPALADRRLYLDHVRRLGRGPRRGLRRRAPRTGLIPPSGLAPGAVLSITPDNLPDGGRAMPKRTDIRSIMIIGAGPIVIGQACEFDYSGAQACKALREEGYRVILVNSNPATIMTDPGMADATYIEPITPEIVAKIIEKERPDALLPTMGGQTGLNTSLALADMGVLEKFKVELIG